MKVLLTQDWSKYKKGEEVEVSNQSVLDKGFAIGLFTELKAKKEVKPKEEK